MTAKIIKVWKNHVGAEIILKNNVVAHVNLLKNKPNTIKYKGLSSRIYCSFIDYFSGKNVFFDFQLDITCGTDFQKKVWEALLTIPYGETRSYGWVAKQIGNPKASRAVGHAVNKNPIPIIIPCHRVISSDGSLGGFACGVEYKRKLLAIEKII